MVVGNLGTSRRFTYTAVGDHVNLGSRVEQLNKIYGMQVLITEHTFEQLEDGFQTRPIDLVRVKGRQHAVQIYELIGSIALDDQHLFRDEFEKALEAYRSRDWEEAFRRFTTIASRAPKDGPTRLYVERCLTMLNRPPSAEWDGAYSMDPL